VRREVRCSVCGVGHLIRLFTTWFPNADATRKSEFAECIRRNLTCAAIDEICVLAEESTDGLPSSDRLHTQIVKGRPHYDDFFRWIAKVVSNEDISIIANTDIWFGNDLGAVERALKGRDCFALARWEPTGLFDRNDSQDCWIFRGQVTGVHGDFPLGVPRCDNRLLYELSSAGYRVRNPAFSIRANHLHARTFQEYSSGARDNFVASPYGYLWPGNLWPLPMVLVHNLVRPEARVAWRFDRRAILASYPLRAARKATKLFTRVLERFGYTTPE
jgi:hypothetical protein